VSWLLDLVPWWGWIIVAAGVGLAAFRVFGLNGLIAALLIGGSAAAYAKGRKAGVADQHAKQVAADTKAKDTIHDVKENVRAIPKTPAGKAERDKRFDRW